MKLPWHRTTAEDGTEKVEVSLPDDVKKQLDAAAKTAEEMPKLRELLEGMTSFQADLKKEKEERERAEAAARAARQRETQGQTQEELEQLMLTDPLAASKKLLEPTQIALMDMRADMLRRETFENAEKFPWYTGEIKTEVDRLIAGQKSVTARCDPGVIENAYYSVVGRMQAKISEGKLKNRFASAEGSRGTATGNTGSGSVDEPLQITDDIKKLAQIFGMKPEEYAKNLKEDGVSYV